MYAELALKGLKILIAEDNAVNQKLIEKLLQKLGCEIDMVWSGKEAVERSEVKQYDLILMAIDMPVMDGIEASKIIHNTINKEHVEAVNYYIPKAETAATEAAIKPGGIDPVIYNRVFCRTMNELTREAGLRV